RTFRPTPSSHSKIFFPLFLPSHVFAASKLLFLRIRTGLSLVYGPFTSRSANSLLAHATVPSKVRFLFRFLITFRNARPIASPSPRGTALPSCTYWLCRNPATYQSSG